jgi:hypothetical protein
MDPLWLRLLLAGGVLTTIVRWYRLDWSGMLPE